MGSFDWHDEAPPSAYSRRWTASSVGNNFVCAGVIPISTVSLDTADADDEFSLFATLAIEDPFPYSDELHLDFLRLFRDEDMQAVFATISPMHRLPLILTTIHGFSCKEAAAILDVPLGTILSRLHRGRRQLEQGLWQYAVKHGLVKVSDEPD
jgi:DNA-directed RNA polymerase specialized sigma24 family protein